MGVTDRLLLRSGWYSSRFRPDLLTNRVMTGLHDFQCRRSAVYLGEHLLSGCYVSGPPFLHVRLFLSLFVGHPGLDDLLVDRPVYLLHVSLVNTHSLSADESSAAQSQVLLVLHILRPVCLHLRGVCLDHLPDEVLFGGPFPEVLGDGVHALDVGPLVGLLNLLEYPVCREALDGLQGVEGLEVLVYFLGGFEAVEDLLEAVVEGEPLQNVSELEIPVVTVVPLEEHDLGELFYLESLGGLLVGESTVGVD